MLPLAALLAGAGALAPRPLLVPRPARLPPRRSAAVHMQQKPANTGSLAEVAAVAAAASSDDARLQTVCVALLGEYGKIKETLDEDNVVELDAVSFGSLVDKLGIECSDSDKEEIFKMIDADGSQTVDASELKSALRSTGAISRMYEESLRTFGMVIALTLAFDTGVFFIKGPQSAFDFLTAYAVEDSLSVDNLFVFLLIFRYFKVPPQLVDTCLNYGITGSIVLRGIFIFAGLAAVNTFQPLLLGFSGFLIFSSYQLLSGGDDDDDEEEELPELVTELLDKLPLTGSFDGDKFTIETPEGVQLTQLTATLVCIALCDVLFAVDSIPAVLAVSEDPFVVYTSNIAAVLGLRSLYQLLSVAVSDLVYLEKAVALVLGFVGVKLAAEVAGVEVSSAISLGVIVSTLATGVIASQLANENERNDYQKKKEGYFLNIVTVLNKLRGAANDLKKK